MESRKSVHFVAKKCVFYLTAYTATADHPRQGIKPTAKPTPSATTSLITDKQGRRGRHQSARPGQRPQDFSSFFDRNGHF